MRVIRPPKPDPFYEITCRHCEALVECKKAELKTYSDRDDHGFILTCPCCAKETWITSSAMRNHQREIETMGK